MYQPVFGVYTALGFGGTMPRVPFPKHTLGPCWVNNFLDSCAFDPKYSPEDQAAQQIKAIGDQVKVVLLLAHSNQKELEHPHTPEDVKREARAMIFTIETDLTPDERRRRAEIHRVLTGNGKPEKYEADARHVFEAGKYMGYFITTDQRILDKRGELSAVCAATIVTPSEWLAIYHAADG
jgi:hypothetical protein